MRNRNIITSTAIMAMALASLSSCIDNDYDLNQMDGTIGVGGTELLIPAGGTDVITLDDILDIDGSDCILTLDDGSYVFQKTAASVEAAHPLIETFVVRQAKMQEGNLSIAGAVSGGRLTMNTKAQIFSYEGVQPDEVNSLNNVVVDNTLQMKFSFPAAMSAKVSTIQTFNVTLPDYMGLTNVTSTVGNPVLEGSVIKLTNIPTNQEINITAKISKLDFSLPGDAENYLRVEEDDSIKLLGDMRVALSANAGSLTSADLTGAKLTSRLEIGDFTILSAEGTFVPNIELTDLGNTQITSLPKFLSEKGVVADLYNPMLMLTVENNMNVKGLVSGTITSKKDGSQLAAVAINNVPINALDTSTICICRRADAVSASQFDHVVEVPTLGNLIRTIPDEVTFDANVVGDKTQVGSFNLGQQYTITPNYSFNSPLTFGKDARIVYKDTLDGWNDDVEDVILSDGAYLQFNATVENRVPAFLHIKAKAIGKDGLELGEDIIKVEADQEIKASADGTTAVASPLEIKIRQVADDGLKQLDGLILTIEAAATGSDGTVVEGITLNAKKHSIIAKDMKLKLVGQVVIED